MSSVTAGEDNTHTLTHVKVTDVFDADTQSKVDLTSMKLVSATIDGEDIAPRTVAVTDEQNRVYGWDIGNLPAGVTALITFKVKLNKDGLSEAVKAEKQGSPETDAMAARTIKNTASASADSVPAVSDDYSTYVKNYVSISKGISPYSYQNQSQNFTITVSAPSTNRYTEYNVPIFDELSNTYASLFSECGITSMTIKHSDGSQEDLTWGNFTQPNSISWCATIPEIRSGDTITIKSYAKVNDNYWNSTTDASNGSGEDTCITNYVYTPENNNEEAIESDGSSDTAETPDGTNIDTPEPTPDSSDDSSDESNNAEKKTSELSKTNDLLPVWLLPLLGIIATSALILTISLRKKH